MDVLASVLIALGLAAAAGLASYRATRPADPLRPRILPWRTISLAAGVGSFLFFVHTLSLAGLSPVNGLG